MPAAPSPEIRHQVLHDAGFRCGNPGCRTPLTLDVHHLEPIAPEGGGSGGEALIGLCPTCHAMHRGGAVPVATLRGWKLLLQSLNEAYGHDAADQLLLMRQVDELTVSGDGLLRVSGLLTSGLVEIRQRVSGLVSGQSGDTFKLRLAAKGRRFLEAWIAGHQLAAVGAAHPG